MPYGEEMRPGAHRAGGEREPCPGITTVFWTFVSNDPLPELGRHLITLQTTAPEVLCARGRLPPPASPASRRPEGPCRGGPVPVDPRLESCHGLGRRPEAGSEGGICSMSSHRILLPVTPLSLHSIDAVIYLARLP